MRFAARKGGAPARIALFLHGIAFAGPTRPPADTNHMRLHLTSLLLATALATGLPAEAQRRPDLDPSLLDSGSVARQFEFVIEKSGRYQEYKVIKQVWIEALEDHVGDTLQALRGALRQDAARIGELEARIGELEANLGATQQTLSDTEAEKDRIRFLGIPMSKSAYGTFVWSLVAILLVLAGLMFTRMRASVGEAAANRKMHDDLQEDYDAYKKRALEREQKLKRELQDELNKRSGG